jgi:dCTP deaminase
MILTGPEIVRQVERGRITIDPFDPELVNPNSYNYRLAPIVKTFEEPVLDASVEATARTFEIPEEGFVLQPRRLYLAKTNEVIGSDTYVPSLIGRSSLGRLGVFLQVSADLGNIGAIHCWTLEIVVVQPVRVYPYMRIGQVSFWRPSGRLRRYEGYFGRFLDPTESSPLPLGLKR